ncbi:MAG: ABC transporter permease [Sphingomicrobium sp.]
MGKFKDGWRIQVRVIKALMIRELTTRFGRENIGFLWIMAEPLLFAGLVAILWRVLKGPEEHGIGVVAFVVSGYVPLTLFRHSVSKCVAMFVANGSLMYHRQIKILDFVLVRFLIEMIGGMMAYALIAVVLYIFDLFPVPASMGFLIMGWLAYCMFTLSLCLVIAPLSEMSDVLEKFIPVVTYIMIPLSGTFYVLDWLTPTARSYLMYSPPVVAMEMMRYGIFGDHFKPYYSWPTVLWFSMVCTTIGLILCRRVRRTLVVE